MSEYVVLLRAVNVGGTGKLPMADLRQLAEEAGFTGVRTYLASGNLIVESDDAAAGVAATMERALHEYAGKPVGVLVRSPAELRRVLDANPFPDEPGNRVLALFLFEDDAADGDDHSALDAITRATRGEQVRAGDRVLYVHYPNGIAGSRLRIPAADRGTARNLNTVTKLASMTGV